MIQLQKVRTKLLNGSLGWHTQLGALVESGEFRRYYVVAGNQAKQFYPISSGPIITEQVLDEEGKWRVTASAKLYTGEPVVPPIIDGRAWVLKERIDSVVFVDETIPLYSTKEHAESAAKDFYPRKEVEAVEVYVGKYNKMRLQQALTFTVHKIIDTGDLNDASIT